MLVRHLYGAVSLLIILSLIPSAAGDVDETTLVFMGDIVLDGILEERINSQGVEYPFEEMMPYFEDADLRFANLEAPISDRGTKEEGKYCTFRSEPGSEDSLVHAGIDVVSLSNNHCLDYGHDALNDTMDILDDSDIRYAGIWYDNDIENSTRPLILEVNGLEIGFLAYTEDVRSHWMATGERPGPLPLDRDLMESDVKYARDLVDILIVSIHWRKWPQYTQGPEESDRGLCRELIDLGVDVIMGHGPHTVHEIEQYNDGLILYSLGNVAMNAGNTSSYNSYIAKVTFDTDKISSLTLIPIKRETYRYVPMGAPIERSVEQGFDVSYDEIHEMYKTDIYNLAEKEKGWAEWKILLEDSPIYIKALLISASVLIIILLIFLTYTIVKRVKKK